MEEDNAAPYPTVRNMFRLVCLDEYVLSSLLSVCDPETGINVKFQNTSCTLDPVSLAKMSVSSLLVVYVPSVCQYER